MEARVDRRAIRRRIRYRTRKTLRGTHDTHRAGERTALLGDDASPPWRAHAREHGGDLRLDGGSERRLVYVLMSAAGADHNPDQAVLSAQASAIKRPLCKAAVAADHRLR